MSRADDFTPGGAPAPPPAATSAPAPPDPSAPTPSREWAKYGVWRGVVRTFRRPADVPLAFTIGAFLWRLPRRLARRPLDEVLRTLAAAPRVPATDPHAGVERIGRLRQAWLVSPLLRARNTCYMRALTLYRFLDPGGGRLRIHFGVEPGVDPADRLHGHAWVTVDGELLEPPEPVVAGRVRELYAFPPLANDAAAAPAARATRARATPSELLATVILAADAPARAAAEETRARGLWENAVCLAALWRVLPHLRARVGALAIDPGPEAARTLATLGAAAAAEAALVCERAGAALALLEREGIAAAGFKGLAAVATLYDGHPARRMLLDADVLIASADFRRAVEALARAGFRPDLEMRLDSWLDMLAERVYPMHDFLDFVDATGAKIDLHWNVRTPSPAALTPIDILARSALATVARRQVRVVAPSDAVLLTTHHLLRERFTPASAVKDLCDVAGWLRRLTPGAVAAADTRDAGEREALVARAAACGLATALLAVVMILERLEPDGAASAFTSRVRDACDHDARATAARLAELFAVQLQHGVVIDLMLGLTSVTPALVRRFVVSRVRSMLDPRYRAHKFPGEAPPRLAPRLRVFAHDLLTLTPHRFAVYRALTRETRRYAHADRADVVERVR